MSAVMETTAPGAWDARALGAMLKAAKAFASKDRALPSLNCARIIADGGLLTVVATDRHVVLFASLTGHRVAGGGLDVCVPLPAVDTIVKGLPRIGPVELADVDGGRLSYPGGTVDVLPGEDAPDLARLIPAGAADSLGRGVGAVALGGPILKAIATVPVDGAGWRLGQPGEPHKPIILSGRGKLGEHYVVLAMPIRVADADYSDDDYRAAVNAARAL